MRSRENGAAGRAPRGARLLIAALWLAGCAEVPESEGERPSEVAPVGEERALAEARASSQVTTMVQGIGDAENATFSSDGRLFVTGGENVYEITKAGDGYAATRLYAGTCNFTGIIERAGVLYTTCGEGPDLLHLTPYLLAAPLVPRIEFQKIHRFTKLGIPNGVAFDARGRLFVSDFTPLAGKIVALSFTSPLSVKEEVVWHDVGHPLANGLKIHEGKVYLTDLGDLKVIPILPDGSAGRVSVLATRLAVFDDLYIGQGGILVGDFYGGQIVSYTPAGRMLGQTSMLFRSPSSITPGRPPLVPEGTFVVTEKGALGELTSTDGNRVSLYRP